MNLRFPGPGMLTSENAIVAAATLLWPPGRRTPGLSGAMADLVVALQLQAPSSVSLASSSR